MTQGIIENNVVKGTIITLEQCCDLIDTHHNIYGQMREQGSSIGAHMRHIIEHFDELFNGIEHKQINYEARKRDLKTERDPDLASQKLRALITKLKAVSQEALITPLSLRESAHPDFADDTHISSLGREITYLNMHTIHHLATIKEILRAQNVAMSHEFGMAPSTIKSEAQNK